MEPLGCQGYIVNSRRKRRKPSNLWASLALQRTGPAAASCGNLRVALGGPVRWASPSGIRSGIPYSHGRVHEASREDPAHRGSSCWSGYRWRTQRSGRRSPADLGAPCIAQGFGSANRISLLSRKHLVAKALPGTAPALWAAPVSLLATAPEHGHGANLPVLRRPTLGRVRRVRRGALRTPRRTRGEGHRRIHLRRHFRSRRDRRTAHGVGRQLPALDRRPTQLSSGLASLAPELDIVRRRQIEADILAGRLDAAGRRADEKVEAGRCTPLSP